MPPDSAESLFAAIRASGLFTPEQVLALVRETAPLGDDPDAVMRHLVEHDRISSYQLRKVIYHKAHELMFGPFVVVDKLGEGGMGKVYRAWQTRLGREVALKVVRPALLANPVVRRRYEREVQAAGALLHPNIVRVFDAGQVDGKHYLAMEFVDGPDLARMVRTYGRLEIPEAVEYLRQAALGLDHAHEQGFVHRDIKPSNVVVCGERHLPQSAEPAFVKILDMGLIRAVGLDDPPGATDLTRDGTVVGTPDYMSPEQAKNSSTVDRRADLYSLGCTAVFLLTGKPPYPDGTAIEKLIRHQLDPPPNLPALRPDVPVGVAAVIGRLLAKKPADRFATAAEVAAALAPFAAYPGGSAPVLVRTRAERVPVGTPETVPAGRSTFPPYPDASSVNVAQVGLPRTAADGSAPTEADHTPDPLAAATAPFDFDAGPGSDPGNPEPKAATPADSRSPAGKPTDRTPVYLAAAGGLVLAAAVVTGLMLTRTPKPAADTNLARLPAATPARVPPTETSSPRPPLPQDSGGSRPPLAEPAFAYESVQNLIPDDAGLIVIAHPGAFLKAGNPFAGAGRLLSYLAQVEDDCGLPLTKAERVVYATVGPGQYLAVAEGPQVAKPATWDGLLPRAFKLMDRQAVKAVAPKLVKAAKMYKATGGVGTRYAMPAGANGQAFALTSTPDLFEKLAVRGAKAPDDLGADVRTALDEATAGAAPPLLTAIARARWVPPTRDGKPLREAGVRMLVLSVRQTANRLDARLTVTADTEAQTREFVTAVAQKLRDEYPSVGPPLALLLTDGERTADTDAGGYPRLTVRGLWGPEAFLEWVGKLAGN